MHCTPSGSKRGRDVHPRVAAVPGVVTAVTLTVAFGLLALGVEWFWVAFPIGFGGVLPAATAAASRRWGGRDEGRRRPAETDATEAELARLREAYATGELDEAEFERRVAELLEAGERP